ncbi:ParB/RepB/Spo0J family partition protein [Brevundimonas sp.]|uniref:ParB/RepB/Spo0J family partition protein n=1 Tax=Brevundimonas sp. TaxID=1871086 RepID=UPI003519527F
MGKPEQTFDVAKTAYKVPVDLIDSDGGLRPLDPEWVVALQGLFTADGQEEPIEIFPKGDGRFGMTAGRQRLAAARALGWATIEAYIDPARRAREISENLFKLGLSPIDHAAFVAELVDLKRAKAGVPKDVSMQSVAATARWADRIGMEADDASRIVRFAFGFADDIAEKVGLSRASIYRALEIHRGLKPEVAEALRGLPVGKNASQLRALAKMPEGDQRQVAGLIVEGQASGVSEAQAILKQAPVKTAEQKAVSAVLGNWSRISPAQQKALLRTLSMPKGVTLMIDGEAVDA